MNVEGLENMKGVKLPKVSQIGIVVPEIGTAVHYFSKFLNIKPWFRSKTRSNDTAFRNFMMHVGRLTGDIDLIPRRDHHEHPGEGGALETVGGASATGANYQRGRFR